MISLAALAAAGAGSCAVLAVDEWRQLHVGHRLEVGSGSADGRWRRSRSALGRLTASTAPGDLARLIEAAGAPGAYSANEVMGVKLILAAVGMLLALLALLAAAATTSGRASLLVIGAPAVGFLLPDLLLRRRAATRRRLLESELPDLADRILLATRAGLPLGRSLSGAAEHGRGLLAQELGRAGARVKLGVSRAEALGQLERRCPLPEVAALVAAIGRADRYGVALEPTLAALASGARADNQRRISERAQGAAPKIQLIVALLLVPAALCCVAAGMIAGLGGS
ncbi:unannotated protein [freshwater metagenome]|uniref:Unannotated protein n=1 Tax=freshwater metagenome TaxID=449393 RepID=A0A6J6A1M3_9ZZZZ|nr:hypothetical protein [Actinomycetota bacterium]